MGTHTKNDIFETITARIIAELEKGPEAWTRTWSTRPHLLRPTNALTGRAYRGINTITLALTAQERGYYDGRWLTFRQALELGGHVRKGEQGTGCIFWNITRGDTDDGPSGADPGARNDKPTRSRFFARTFTVFNIEQCDGLDAEQMLTATPEPSLPERIVRSSGATFVDGNPAFIPALDVIAMPPEHAFVSRDEFFATAFHELVHWSGPRVGRPLNAKRFGDDAYAIEELTAELGAAMLCGVCSIGTIMQHASYLNHWIKILRSDKRAIVSVASASQRAADYLLERAGVATPESESSAIEAA